MNINAVNLNNEESIKAVSINVKANTEKESEGVSATFANALVSQMGSTTSTSNQKQGVASMMKSEGEEVIEQIKESATNAKGSLSALYKKLSGADCVSLEEDGYGLNDTKPEKIVTVVERIKIMLATYCEDYKLTGMSVSSDDIKEILGSTAMAASVANKLNEYDVPASDDNVKEIAMALDELKSSGELTENAKNYMVKNHIDATIDNIYNAIHKSAGIPKTPNSLNENQWQQLKPQIDELIKNSGLAVNEQNENNAKTFIGMDIPVTKENLQYKAMLDELNIDNVEDKENLDKVLDRIAMALSEGKHANEALLVKQNQDWKDVSEAIKTIWKADKAHVISITDADRTLNIAELKKSIASININDYKDRIANMTDTELSNYRKLEETRMLMTADAGLNLVKQGFNIDTKSLSELVEELKQVEFARLNEVTKEEFNENEVSNEIKETVIDSCMALYDISVSPVDTLANVLEEALNGGVVSLETLADTGHSLRERYSRLGKTYEAVGTQVRTDLGDSIQKAVKASTESILDELKLEQTEANKDAVRILANNSMEITKENIDKIKEMYATLTNLIDNMKPEAVLKMIRAGINPMDSDIRDVNEYLMNLNENSTNEDKYSRFLMKLDRTNGITDEERKKFIGIYKMMNIFRKDAGKAVGALLNQNSELTMQNLMTAYNSNKVKGMDKIVNDENGFVDVRGAVNYYNTLFSQTAPKITPNTLKKTEEENPILDRSIENFCEAVQDNYDINEEALYYSEFLDSVKTAKEADESVLRELSKFDMAASIDNINAMTNIMEENYFNTRRLALNAEVLNESENEEDLFRKLEELAQSSDEQLERVMDSIENEEDYDTFEQMRMLNKEIHTITNTGAKHDYHIPYENNGQIGNIHLQLVSDEENAGRIAIDATSAEIGKIHMEIKIENDTMNIFALTSDDQALLTQKVSNAVRDISLNFVSFGITSIHMNTGKSEVLPENDLVGGNQKSSTRRLYQIARKMILEVC